MSVIRVGGVPGGLLIVHLLVSIVSGLHYYPQYANNYANGPQVQMQPFPVQQDQQQTAQQQIQQNPPQNLAKIYESQQSQEQNFAPPTSANNPRDRDSPIFRAQGQALNSTAIKLVWNLVNGHHADYFQIEYGPIPDATRMFRQTKLNGTSRDFTFTGLDPDTTYQFELVSYLNDRAFKPQLVLARTPSANQQIKSNVDNNQNIMPLGVKAEAKSNSSIQLTWTEPERPLQIKNSHKVNVIRYYINPSPQLQPGGVQAYNDQNPASQSAIQYLYFNVTDARESKLIVQKLKPATEYAFAIKTMYYTPDMKRYFTSSGFSMDTFARTFDIEPTAPRNFSVQLQPPTKEEIELIQQQQATGQVTSNIQAGKLELSWQPPESPNGQLKGYVILYTVEQGAADDKWHRIEVAGGQINNWKVANIRPGYSYYFKIRAVNQRGQSPDSETILYAAPPALPLTNNDPLGSKSGMPNNMPAVPANNVLLLIVICMLAILFILFLVVSKLACKTRRKPRKSSLDSNGKSKKANNSLLDSTSNGGAKLNSYHPTNSSSTVTARVGTLARRRDQSSNKPDFWISAIDHNSVDVKSNCSEKSQQGDMNMAMVSIQRESPQFTTTTQLAPVLPDYCLAAVASGQGPVNEHILHQLQQHQSHYHPGQFASNIGYDQMDNATASALMTLSKRQQQQLQKYQIQFAGTGGPPTSMAGGTLAQAPSPNQQPPPPPPLNIEQQHQQQQQSLYGTHHAAMGHTRSLRLHRPTLYDPVSGAFVQASGTENAPPNYSSHQVHPTFGSAQQPGNLTSSFQNSTSMGSSANSNTIQFSHPHHTGTLLSRRSTNTLRSFHNSAANSIYGQLGANNNTTFASSFMTSTPTSIAGITNQSQQPQQLLQSHQAVINQLNNSAYPSLPLKHVSTVRPQIMSSLEDQIEMELAEKEQQQHDQQPTIKQ